MLLVPLILTLAFGAGYFSEARFILVVHDLVSRHCHLVAPIASNRLMRANFVMLFHLTDVILAATVIRTVSESLFTSFLQVLLHIIEADLRFRTAIRAPKNGFVED